MAAALGPPEVIAQLENAAKVLMVSGRAPAPRVPRPLPPAALLRSALAPAGLAAGRGLPGARGWRGRLAWRRTLPPAVRLPPCPWPDCHFPGCPAPPPRRGVGSRRKGASCAPALQRGVGERRARGRGLVRAAGEWVLAEGWPGPGAVSSARSPRAFGSPTAFSGLQPRLGNRSRPHVERPAGWREGGDS